MYKRDQGMTTRVVTFLLFLLGGFYSGYCWYYFTNRSALGQVGAVGLLLGLAAWGWMLSFRKEKSGEFLIELDGELRKVKWPALKPLFDPKTEAWGSTYVVIACTAVFTVLIFALDAVLGFGIHQVLFKYLIFG